MENNKQEIDPNFRASVLALPKQNLASKTNSQDMKYEKFVSKIGLIVDEMNSYTKENQLTAKSIIKSHFKDKVDNIKSKFTLESGLTKIFNPSGKTGIFSKLINNVISNQQQKSLIKEEKNQFAQNYFENTKVGRALDPKSKLGKEKLESAFKEFNLLKTHAEKAQKTIDAKNQLKSKFGFGGPNQKDVLALENAIKLMNTNNIKLFEGKNPAINSMSMKKEKAETVNVKKSESTNLENQRESLDLTSDSLDTLKQIEENTRLSSGSDISKEEKPKLDLKFPGSGFFGGIIDSIMGFIGGSFLSIIKKLFNPSLLFKALTKFILPAMIIGSIVNGIMDGFTEWKKSGSISEALIAGLGGIVEFLTFGLFDKESLRSAFDYVSESAKKLTGFFIEYVINPFKEYIIDPIVEYVYKPIYDMIKSVYNTIVGFANNIPGIELPVMKDWNYKKGPIGEEPSETKSDIEKSKPQKGQMKSVGKAVIFVPDKSEGSMIKSKIDQVAEAKKEAASSQSNTQNVNAPTTINNSSKTNIVSRNSVRNSEPTFNRYLRTV